MLNIISVWTLSIIALLMNENDGTHIRVSIQGYYSNISDYGRPGCSNVRNQYCHRKIYTVLPVRNVSGNGSLRNTHAHNLFGSNVLTTLQITLWLFTKTPTKHCTWCSLSVYVRLNTVKFSPSYFIQVSKSNVSNAYDITQVRKARLKY